MDLLALIGEWLTAIQWRHLLGQEPLEIIGTVAGVLGLVLLAQEKRAGWLVGMIWAITSAYLAFFSWNLVSDSIMYLVYLPIQLYCWQAWGSSNSTNDHTAIIPSWLPQKRQWLLLFSIALSITLWSMTITWLAVKVSWVPEPAMLWRDSTTTVLNFFAQFLMAKKRMENWLLWVVVNVLGINIYLLQGSTIYALQYGLFLLLGLYGWWQWQQHRKQAHSSTPQLVNTV